MTARKHREIHDAEQTKKMVPLIAGELPLVNMSASWFLVSTYLIWILGSKLTLSYNLFKATQWVLDTCLIVELLPFVIILITASLSSKMYNCASNWEELAFVVTKVHMRQLFNISVTTSFRFGVGICASDSTACSTSRHLIIDLEGCSLKNAMLRSPHPTDREQGFHPFAVQHPTK